MECSGLRDGKSEKNKGKSGVRNATGIPDPLVYIPLKDPLEEECHYGNDHEDYYEPSCDFHRETSYTFHAHDKKHQGKDKEDNREVD